MYVTFSYGRILGNPVRWRSFRKSTLNSSPPWAWNLVECRRQSWLGPTRSRDLSSIGPRELATEDNWIVNSFPQIIYFLSKPSPDTSSPELKGIFVQKSLQNCPSNELNRFEFGPLSSQKKEEISPDDELFLKNPKLLPIPRRTNENPGLRMLEKEYQFLEKRNAAAAKKGHGSVEEM